MNEILLKKICQLIGMVYAIPKETVWSIYLEKGSIDETLRIVSKT